MSKHAPSYSGLDWTRYWGCSLRPCRVSCRWWHKCRGTRSMRAPCPTLVQTPSPSSWSSAWFAAMASSCCSVQSQDRSRCRCLSKSFGQLIWLHLHPRWDFPPYYSHHSSQGPDWIISGTCFSLWPTNQPLLGPCLRRPLEVFSLRRPSLLSFCATCRLPFQSQSLPSPEPLVPTCCPWARIFFRSRLSRFRCGAKRISHASSLSQTCRSGLGF